MGNFFRITLRKKVISKILLVIGGFFLILTFNFFATLTACKKSQNLSQRNGFFNKHANDLLVENWSEELIERYGIHSEANVADKLLSIALPVDKSDYYGMLQKKIAELIPKESQRSTVDLWINGGNPNSVSSCAILGGMGPLSDARILDLIIRKLKEKNVSDRCTIKLMSAPPPRAFFEVISDIQRYLINLHLFLNADNHQHRVYLASNTAHIYFNFLNTLARGKVVNLTEYVVDRAESCVEHPHVLIIGTKVARKKRLYEKLFEKKGVQYANVNSEQQEVVQEEINKTKAGRSQADDDTLYNIICDGIKAQKIKGTPVNVLLLGCTELSIALEGKLDELKRLGVVVLDSEELFAEKISIDIERFEEKEPFLSHITYSHFEKLEYLIRE